MKLISVFVLSLCLFAATFSNLIMMAAYEVNTTYIAEKLCVNKNKPAMHCNGKCYLAKQMNKAEQPATSNTAKEKFEIQLFCCQAAAINFSAKAANQCLRGFQSNLHSYLYNNSCFHPPCFA